MGLGSGQNRQERGYPPGQGRPEDIPQTFKDEYQSTWEQWDLDLVDDSNEDSEDIIAYDTTTSRHMTRAERNRKEA